jgi:hypothetical protein
VNPGELGADLERLPGVLAATLFNDSPGGPRVFLATSADADPDAIRDAVLGMLRDRGYPADPERIHVGVPPRRDITADALRRFSLDGLDVHRTEGRVECTIRLRTTTRSTIGRATEPDSAAGRARAAVRATLGAVEELDPDLHLGLEGVRALDLFGRETVAVLIEAAAGRAHIHLPGIAMVHRSVEEAAVMATLTALRGWKI